MSDWKGAWYLAKHELYVDRWKGLFSLAFIVFLLIFATPLIQGALQNEDLKVNSFITNLYYLAVLPNLGFVMNQTMMRCWKDNTYTKKIAHWRTLPISSKQIAIGRLIQLSIVMSISLFLFFGIQFIAFQVMGSEISIVQFILYGLFWYGYSLVIAVGYVYFEMGHSGKMYFSMTFVYMFFYLLLTIALAVMDAGSIIVRTLHTIDSGNSWIVLIALAAGVAALIIGKKQLVKRLEDRSYMS